MIKDSVQIPSWVNSGNDEYVTKIAEGIASGRIEMYAEEKVGKSTVGFRRVRLYDDIIEEREETNDEYKETIQEIPIKIPPMTPAIVIGVDENEKMPLNA